MPLKIYCGNCSEPTEYTLTKPLFCGMCGAKFDGSISIASQKSKPKLVNYPKIKELKSDINDDFDNLDDGESLPESLPNIDKLDVKIESFGSEDSIKLGEVMLQQKTGLNRPKTKRVNKKAEFEKFRAQAGAGGKQVIEIADRDKD